MRVGFLANQLDNRGTGNALFDYAYYNQSRLGNKSLIFSYLEADHSPYMLRKLREYFDSPHYIGGPAYVESINNVDVLYHIKYGNDDGIRTSPNIRYAVHSVFSNDPHGDRYATVSRWLAGNTSTPFVPHIVDVPTRIREDIRNTYYIPETAIVFGRYGAEDTFDIDFVWEVIAKILQQYNNTWFLFANTPTRFSHSRIISLEQLKDQQEKADFIHATDYMLHARGRGETFGISVGEFGILGKPIITYGRSPERAHIEEIGTTGYLYNDKFDLYEILMKLSGSRFRPYRPTYTEYTPEKVMEKFKEVFLS